MEETERKFLVKKDIWQSMEKPEPVRIVQAYLSDNEHATVRVRIKGEHGFITVKGITAGITRPEYEYEISTEDVLEMIAKLGLKSLSKDRYSIRHEGHVWEVDEFHGKLASLVLAEIELGSEDEQFEIPGWVGEEVSHDPEYYNSRLIRRL